MLGAIERVERRKAAKHPLEPLLFQTLLLEEVRDGRGEGEREQGITKEVRRDVDRQDRAPVLLRGLGRRDEARGEEERERERRDEDADHVDPVAPAHHEVHDACEHRDDAHREVNALDRADVPHEGRHDDVRGVERRAGGDETRREPAGEREPFVAEERNEQRARREVGAGGCHEQAIDDERAHVSEACPVRRRSARAAAQVVQRPGSMASRAEPSACGPCDTPDPRGSRTSFPSTLTLTDSELPKLVPAPTAPETRRGRRTALAVLLLLSFLVVAWIASPLWIGIALGAVMAFTAQAPFRRLSERLGERRRLAAGLRTLGSGLLCAGVAAVVFYVASGELLAFVEYLRGRLSVGSPSECLGGSVLGFLRRVGVNASALDARIHQRAPGIATGYATTAAAAIVEATTSAVLGLMIALATMYYVLIDWTRLALRLESVLPLDPRHTRALILEFRDVGRGTLVGTIGTALVQGALAGVGYAIGGAHEVATFGLLTAIASLLPIFGTGTIWLPVGIAQIVTGHVFGGVFIVAWGFLVVMTLTDYVIRPRLVGSVLPAAPFFILIALLGGVEAIGLPGISSSRRFSSPSWRCSASTSAKSRTPEAHTAAGSRFGTRFGRSDRGVEATPSADRKSSWVLLLRHMADIPATTAGNRRPGQRNLGQLGRRISDGRVARRADAGPERFNHLPRPPLILRAPREDLMRKPHRSSLLLALPCLAFAVAWPPAEAPPAAALVRRRPRCRRRSGRTRQSSLHRPLRERHGSGSEGAGVPLSSARARAPARPSRGRQVPAAA